MLARRIVRRAFGRSCRQCSLPANELSDRDKLLSGQAFLPMDRGSALTSFQAVTSADEPQALQYLEVTHCPPFSQLKVRSRQPYQILHLQATDWNLEAAINLFLSDPQPAQHAAPVAHQNGSAGYAPACAS